MAERKYDTAEKLAKAVDAYFSKCCKEDMVPSEAGLAQHLKVSVYTLRKWHDGETCADLRETVWSAYARMTEMYLQLLSTGNKNMTPFVIFMLKQPRFAGYQDKVEARSDISVNVKMGGNMDATDFQ